MVQLERFFAHVTTLSGQARRAFPTPTLKALQDVIAEGEARHRAQLRLIIEPSLGWSDLRRNMSSRARAHRLFSRYRIWDTEENCGVLVYINLADRKVEIITDRAVGRAVKRSEWEAACDTMTRGFRHGQFHESALAGIRHMNELLAEHFPAREGDSDRNELSDRPVML